MAWKRQIRLERVLDDNALFSTAYGNVGSSIYYALGLVAAFALGMTPVVFIVAGIIFWFTATTYTEATAMYPEAGGSSSFARRAFGERASFGAAWVQIMNFIVTAAISALFVPHYLGFIWPALRESPADMVAGAFVILLLAAINIRGVREVARLNVVMAVTDLMTQLALVVGGILLVLNFDTLSGNIDLWQAPTVHDFLLSIPIAMIAYTGIETVSNLSEEARDATRTVPKAMRKVVLAVVIIYAALPAISLSALPVTKSADGGYETLLGVPQDEGGFAADPVLGVVKSLDLGPLEGAAEIYVGLLAATILILAANAGLSGLSRLLYGMGNYQQLPSAVSRLHSRFRTPYVGLALAAAVAALLLLGPATFLGNLYAAFAMLSFTVAHASVIALRRNRPDEPRPYRGPGNLQLRGWSLPLFAVLGGIGTSVAFVVAVGLHPEVAAVGVVWLAIGALTFAGLRRRLGFSVSETRKLEQPLPVLEGEVVYSSILVVCDPAEDPEEALRVARRLADQPRHVHFLALVPVPDGYPFDYPLESEEEAAARSARLARKLLGPRATIRTTRCPRNRKASTIIREALLRRAEAIVMPMPPVQKRISQDNLFGETRLRLLDERPCRVLLVEPATARTAFSTTDAGPIARFPIENIEPLRERRRRGNREIAAPEQLMACVFGEALDDDVMQTACRLASPAAGGQAIVHAVAICDVPHGVRPEDVEPAELARMAAALRRAEAVGQEYESVEVVPHLCAAPHVGLTMVRLAQELNPSLLLIGADDAAAEERDADAVTLRDG